MFLALEFGLMLFALALAFLVPNLGSRWFGALEQRFAKLAERRGLSVLVVGLTALALRAALLPILPIPAPGVSDEFGYLLLSDTFAHGRLTNPTNPMWVHFETFQVIWQPTCTAKYYPAQGLFMALGRPSFLGRLVERRLDVRRHHLDAARVAGTGLGVAGRFSGGDSSGNLQLLGQ